MTLADLNINQTAKVLKINCDEDLKRRFYSFGITKGALITVEEVSLAKNTLEINIEDTSVGMRIVEASSIEVVLI